MNTQADELAGFSVPAWRAVYDKWRARFLQRAREATQRPQLYRRMIDAVTRPPESEQGWEVIKQTFLALIAELDNPPPEPPSIEDRNAAEVIADWSDQPNFPQAPEGNAAPLNSLTVPSPKPWTAADQELIDWLTAAQLPARPLSLARHWTIPDPQRWRVLTLGWLELGPDYAANRLTLRRVAVVRDYLAQVGV